MTDETKQSDTPRISGYHLEMQFGGTKIVWRCKDFEHASRLQRELTNAVHVTNEHSDRLERELAETKTDETKQSDTPRCDEMFFEAQETNASAFVVDLKFAQELEHELAEARAQIEKHKNLLIAVHDFVVHGVMPRIDFGTVPKKTEPK